MKIAISVPDDLFEAAERLVKTTKRTRSAVYAEALREYVTRRTENEITEAWNAVLAEIDQEADLPFLRAAAYETLKNAEW